MANRTKYRVIPTRYYDPTFLEWGIDLLAGFGCFSRACDIPQFCRLEAIAFVDLDTISLYITLCQDLQQPYTENTAVHTVLGDALSTTSTAFAT